LLLCGGGRIGLGRTAGQDPVGLLLLAAGAVPLLLLLLLGGCCTIWVLLVAVGWLTAVVAAN